MAAMAGSLAPCVAEIRWVQLSSPALSTKWATARRTKVVTLSLSARDAALTRSGTHFRSEPPSLETVWRARTALNQPATKRWTDLYLAAFAHGHGLRLVTFDQGFKRLTEIEVTLLGEMK